MSKSRTEKKMDPSDVSPVRESSSNQVTPIRPMRKLSRRHHGTDVHSTFSTPHRLLHGVQCSSPSDSFPYSQEFHPDVIWDYTSPKLPCGSKKREIKITVEEFLKNLSQRPVPECNSQTSNYVRLLEKWMAKQNTPVCKVKAHPKNLKQNNKKRSRRVIDEIRQFMESIQKKNDTAEENQQEEKAGEMNVAKTENPNHFNDSLKKISFLEGDSTENDSAEDLWGEMDNSFIIKATQQLEASSMNYNNILDDRNVEIVSTIPDTISTVPVEFKCATSEVNQNTEKNILNKIDIDPDHHAQILLTQIISNDWDSESDIDDWENGFIEEDEALSLIPDEVLCGTDAKQEENVKINQNDVRLPSQVQVVNENSKLRYDSIDSKPDTKDRSKEISFGYSESVPVTCQTVDPSSELFNNFEDESFGDESILCEPEVLSWLDEVESKLSQSQKCTPEEIEKKKDEAVQRRKRNLSRNCS